MAEFITVLKIELGILGLNNQMLGFLKFLSFYPNT